MLQGFFQRKKKEKIQFSERRMDLSKIVKGFIHVYRRTERGSTASHRAVENIVYKNIYKLITETNINNYLQPRVCFNCSIENIDDPSRTWYPYSQDVADIFYELVVCGQTIDADFSYVMDNLSHDEVGAIGLMMEYSK